MKIFIIAAAVASFKISETAIKCTKWFESYDSEKDCMYAQYGILVAVEPTQQSFNCKDDWFKRYDSILECNEYEIKQK